MIERFVRLKGWDANEPISVANLICILRQCQHTYGGEAFIKLVCERSPDKIVPFIEDRKGGRIDELRKLIKSAHTKAEELRETTSKYYGELEYLIGERECLDQELTKHKTD